MALESSETEAEDSPVFEFDQFRADLRARTLVCSGQPVAITSKVFDTLAYLLRNHGRVVDKDQLLQAIWPDTIVEEGNLHHYVSTVRKILGEKSGAHRFIVTMPGRGYSFVAPVRVVALESHAEPAALEPAVLEPHVEPRIPRGRLTAAACIVAVAALLVLVSQSVAHRIRPKSPSITPLTASLGVADMASFSPDGKELVFSWRAPGEQNFHIYTKAIGSESMRPITSGPGTDSRPAWSRDGLRIAFVRNKGDGAEYSLVPARGGPVTTLTRGMTWSGKAPNVAWSQDGKHLTIEDMGTSGQPTRLYLLSLDTRQRRLLTFAAEQWGDGSPAVSPDGKMLAYLRTEASGRELRVMPAMGGESRIVLEHDRDVGTAGGIAWTPDSRGIVYHSVHGGFWKVPLSGGVPERLGVGSDYAYYPAISASGNLAFTEPVRQVTLVSAALPSAGQAPAAVRELLSSTRTVFDPQWSPDGQQIAFYSDRSGSTEIWRSDANGGNLLRLTSFGGPHTRDPRWSPDGKSIAFDSRLAGNADVYVISANGGVPRKLMDEPSADTNPAWSNDGKTIYFSSNRSGVNQIWKMPAAGGAASQVTSDGGVFPAISADPYLYFLKAWSSRNLFRMPLEGGKEEVVLDGAIRAPRLWTPTQGGVYYIDHTTALRFFDLRSRQHSDPLLQFATPEITVESTIGASLDGRSILVPRVREAGTDIMVVERFW